MVLFWNLVLIVRRIFFFQTFQFFRFCKNSGNFGRERSRLFSIRVANNIWSVKIYQTHHKASSDGSCCSNVKSSREESSQHHTRSSTSEGRIPWVFVGGAPDFRKEGFSGSIRHSNRTKDHCRSENYM